MSSRSSEKTSSSSSAAYPLICYSYKSDRILLPHTKTIEVRIWLTYNSRHLLTRVTGDGEIARVLSGLAKRRWYRAEHKVGITFWASPVSCAHLALHCRCRRRCESCNLWEGCIITLDSIYNWLDTVQSSQQERFSTRNLNKLGTT